MLTLDTVKNWCARLTRKLILRGRAATGYYSLEGHRQAPDEPEQAIVARRAGHYGLVSECPDGAEVVVLAIGGGATNRVAVGEWLTDEPTVDRDGCEVLLWCKHGQRVLLNKDGDVFIYPKTGRSVYIGDSNSGNCDPVVTRSELNTDLETLKTVFNTHAHTGVTTGMGSSGTTSVALSPSWGFMTGSPNVLAKKP